MDGVDEFRRKVVTTFHTMKFDSRDRPNESWIPIYNRGELILHLRPVPAVPGGVATNDARLISEWRNDHRESFFTWFTSTEESTRRWIREQVTPREDRILFMIQPPTGAPIGHVGLTNFDFRMRTCECDNVIRGVDGVVPGALTFACKTLLQWVFSYLGAESVTLRVFSDNIRAVNLYERCGFRVVGRVPSKRIDEAGTIRWVEMQGNEEYPAERFIIHMVAYGLGA